MISPTSPILAHLPLIESVASAIAAEARSRHAGAEYDDLRQEGMIYVWEEDVQPELSGEEQESFEQDLAEYLHIYVRMLARQAGLLRR